MKNTYDTIIIGTGPAGLSAAIYAKRREMNTLVIGKDIGGQMIWASEIENYPGFKSIKSFELIAKMFEQVTDLGVEVKNIEVTKIEKQDDHFLVKAGQEEYIGRTVILALGLAPKNLNIPGEKEFGGKGISYCANCDGPFFKGKTVAVIGGGNAALDAAEIMSKIAKQVYIVQLFDNFSGFEILVKEIQSRANIQSYMGSELTEIIGTEKVEKIKVKNNKSGEVSELDVDGVFIEVGRIAKTDLVKDLVKTDERDQIIVNDCCSTSQPGLFAAGDVTQVPFKQITIASGQGTIAALAAYQYLQLQSNKRCKVCCPNKD